MLPGVRVNLGKTRHLNLDWRQRCFHKCLNSRSSEWLRHPWYWLDRLGVTLRFPTWIALRTETYGGVQMKSRFGVIESLFGFH